LSIIYLIESEFKMEQSSQKPGIPPPQQIHHELRTAENSAVYILEKLESMRKRNPNLKLLDVGPGSGTISVTLAEAIPDGYVTAIDLKPEILPRAAAIAEMAGVKNIEFQQGDANKLSFADDSFDITVCRQESNCRPPLEVPPAAFIRSLANLWNLSSPANSGQRHSVSRSPSRAATMAPGFVTLSISFSASHGASRCVSTLKGGIWALIL
jgi:SAM-dependent methyltransferase